MTLSPIAPALLEWFNANKRILPFRQDPTPYHIWVSEIMLQQTRVSAAIPYYLRFIEELPDIPALAACDPQRLNKLWEGLGYYSRVRNMQKAAQQVCRDYGGQLPADLKALKSLPGIGDYTAGAVASIGFRIPAPAVDGNVLRVFSRLYNDDRDITLPSTKTAYTDWVMEHQPPDKPGPYNEALMELGALVCLPGGEPLCDRCPLSHLCRAKAAGTQLDLPVKPAPKAKKLQSITLALVKSEKGWLVRQRPRKGLLAGLWEPVLWEERLTKEEATSRLEGFLPGAEAGEPLPAARHIFTHIQWEMEGWFFTAPALPLPEGYAWANRQALESLYPLPNAFKKYKPLMN